MINKEKLIEIWDEIDVWFHWKIKPIYTFFRYDLKYGILNFWKFRKEIWRFRSWDYGFNVDLFARSIELTCDTIENNGMEIPETKDPKVKQMKRFIWLAQNYKNSYELAEENKIPWHVQEAEMWKEMWTIIGGSENEGKYVDTDSHGKVWVSDGTNAQGWWD